MKKEIIIAMPDMGNDLFRKYMKSKYVKSIERAGGKVVTVELSDKAAAAKKAAEFDGLLLPGGADIDPKMYNRKREEKCGKPNETRDTVEPEILREFLKTGKPVLGICRGMQLLNVCFGGTLFQDIKKIQKSKHMDFFNRSKHSHTAKVEKKSKLYETVKSEEIKINSMHHQAIENVGKGLSISATSDDGFVEGIELQNYGFCLGVQWHPEHMSKKNAVQQNIFNEFIKECGAKE